MGNPRLDPAGRTFGGPSRPKIVEDMAHAVLTLKREGLSILLSEQNLHFARLIADRVAIIERGRVAASGTLAELDARPDVYDAFLAV